MEYVEWISVVKGVHRKIEQSKLLQYQHEMFHLQRIGRQTPLHQFVVILVVHSEVEGSEFVYLKFMEFKLNEIFCRKETQIEAQLTGRMGRLKTRISRDNILVGLKSSLSKDPDEEGSELMEVTEFQKSADKTFLNEKLRMFEDFVSIASGCYKYCSCAYSHPTIQYSIFKRVSREKQLKKTEKIRKKTNLENKDLRIFNP